MPGALTAIAKVMPLTHALALLRYGFIDPSGQGLHDIWGMSNVALEAWLASQSSRCSPSRWQLSRSACSRAWP